MPPLITSKDPKEVSPFLVSGCIPDISKRTSLNWKFYVESNNWARFILKKLTAINKLIPILLNIWMSPSMLSSFGLFRVLLLVLVSLLLLTFSTCLTLSDWDYSFFPLLLNSPSLGEIRKPNSRPLNLWIIYFNTELPRLSLKRMPRFSPLKRRLLIKALLTQPRVFKIYTTNWLPSLPNKLLLNEQKALDQLLN